VIVVFVGCWLSSADGLLLWMSLSVAVVGSWLSGVSCQVLLADDCRYRLTPSFSIVVAKL
jgi:hypothetical protein